MRILDLDLDCFISDIAQKKKDDGQRLDDSYIPWTDDQFREFLEHKCGMSTEFPIPGRIFKYHKEAFKFWESLSKGRCDRVLDIVHVDAHADMGMGDTSYVYIMNKLLFAPLEDRLAMFRESDRLNSGNFLIYACVCGWINSLTFVHHQLWRAPGGLLEAYFKDCDPRKKALQLKGYRTKHYRELLMPNVKHLKPEKTDPEIRFSLVRVDDYSDTGNWDFATISQSPGFTPESADKLLEIFIEYIDENA